MPLSIKHPEADEMARKLAEITGLSITEAVTKALREQLRRETGRDSAGRLVEELRAISDRCAALPDYDTRSPEEILGFDEHGLPAEHGHRYFGDYRYPPQRSRLGSSRRGYAAKTP